MPTNKNAQLRYQILDRCFSDYHHKYTIDDLIKKVNEALFDLCGTQISIRQIREDIKYMRDRVTYNAPIEAYPFGPDIFYFQQRTIYRRSSLSSFRNRHTKSIPWCAEQCLAGKCHIEFGISLWHYA